METRIGLSLVDLGVTTHFRKPLHASCFSCSLVERTSNEVTLKKLATDQRGGPLEFDEHHLAHFPGFF